MSTDRAAEYLAHRVLEQWCLVGEEPMEGEQWQLMCDLAGVNAEDTATGAMYLRSIMTPVERQARLRQIGQERKYANGIGKWNND